MKNLLILFFVFSINFLDNNTYNVEYSPQYLKSAPPLEMFYAIQTFSDKYEVPRSYAYGIAYKETGYTGPFDYDYRQGLTSSAGALGPMQVMYSTAKYMWPNRDFSRDYLKEDIQFNVETSMKFLRHLHNKYNNWEIALGYYNTGDPIITSYSKFVVNYQPNF